MIVLIIILIKELILLLENKESFSLGGQGKGKKLRKAQKLAKKIATKEGIQTLRQNGIRKLSKNVEIIKNLISKLFFFIFIKIK